MIYDTLIVENDQISGQILASILKKLGHNVLAVVPDFDSALIMIRHERPDVVFMDISIDGRIDGIYGAELISKFIDIAIVFISVHAEQSIIQNAKQYGEFYIIKPFTAYEVENSLKQIEKKSLKNQTPEPKISVKKDNEIHFIKFADISYIEAQAHFMIINVNDSQYMLRSSLKKIMELDPNNYLIQVHKSYAVNKNSIESLINENYSYRIKLKESKILIPVSKKHTQAIKKVLMNIY